MTPWNKVILKLTMGVPRITMPPPCFPSLPKSHNISPSPGWEPVNQLCNPKGTHPHHASFIKPAISSSHLLLLSCFIPLRCHPHLSWSLCPCIHTPGLNTENQLCFFGWNVLSYFIHTVQWHHSSQYFPFVTFSHYIFTYACSSIFPTGCLPHVWVGAKVTEK